MLTMGFAMGGVHGQQGGQQDTGVYAPENLCGCTQNLNGGH